MAGLDIPKRRGGWTDLLGDAYQNVDRLPAGSVGREDRDADVLDFQRWGINTRTSRPGELWPGCVTSSQAGHDPGHHHWPGQDGSLLYNWFSRSEYHLDIKGLHRLKTPVISNLEGIN